jgi:hypothetical protein
METKCEHPKESLLNAEGGTFLAPCAVPGCPRGIKEERLYSVGPDHRIRTHERRYYPATPHQAPVWCWAALDA